MPIALRCLTIRSNEACKAGNLDVSNTIVSWNLNDVSPAPHVEDFQALGVSREQGPDLGFRTSIWYTRTYTGSDRCLSVHVLQMEHNANYRAYSANIRHIEQELINRWYVRPRRSDSQNFPRGPRISTGDLTHVDIFSILWT